MVLGTNPFTAYRNGNTLDTTGGGCPRDIDPVISNANFWTFTPTISGPYVFDMDFDTGAGEGFDSKLVIMNTCTTSDGVLACGEDTSYLRPGAETLPADLTAGTTYYIALGGYNDPAAVGPGTLTISMPPSGTFEECTTLGYCQGGGSFFYASGISTKEECFDICNAYYNVVYCYWDGANCQGTLTCDTFYEYQFATQWARRQGVSTCAPPPPTPPPPPNPKNVKTSDHSPTHIPTIPTSNQDTSMCPPV